MARMVVTVTREWSDGTRETETNDYVWDGWTAAEMRRYYRNVLRWPADMCRTVRHKVGNDSWTEHTHRQFTDEPAHDKPA